MKKLILITIIICAYLYAKISKGSVKDKSLKFDDYPGRDRTRYLIDKVNERLYDKKIFDIAATGGYSYKNINIFQVKLVDVRGTLLKTIGDINVSNLNSDVMWNFKFINTLEKIEKYVKINLIS